MNKEIEDKTLEITPPELWLQQRSFSNPAISHPHAGDQYVQYVSDVMREYAKYVVSTTNKIDQLGTQKNLK